jgi:phosphonate transport system ATP-binding protein
VPDTQDSRRGLMAPPAPGPGAHVASRTNGHPGDAALVVRGLTKSFGSRRVLNGVHFTVRSGESVAMLGANGSGKSTALRCVVGLVEPDEGTVVLAGRDITSVTGGELTAARREAAMIFQQIHLVRRLTALDNVCCGALGRLPTRRSLLRSLFPAGLREEAMTCLERVGLADRAEERASRLSGGQQQRVAIARALCQRASVILADEPVSALDPAATEYVMTLLHDLAHDDGLAVVSVLHQPELARRYADRVLGVRDGTISFDEAPDAVDPDEVSRLYYASESA